MKAPTWRAEMIAGNKAMIYGNDHSIGHFITIWELADPAKSLNYGPNQPHEDNLIIDRDEFDSSLPEQEMISIAGRNGFKLTMEDLN